mmetsp:Transcript_68483/g.164466  ORF Transcript_68483/g.164466 Transcript_68483/m.164466 type:complete len:82 (+) Transcript_68483:217-462(+)
MFSINGTDATTIRCPRTSEPAGRAPWRTTSKETMSGKEKAEAHGNSIGEPHITMQRYKPFTVDAIAADAATPRHAFVPEGK